jgi:4-hydroxy-3-methylbut-2-enyl diphosphate reductase IspH
LVSTLEQIDGLDLEAVCEIGLTSGASTPESFLDAAVARLRERYGFPAPERLMAVEEDSLVFKLPRSSATALS